MMMLAWVLAAALFIAQPQAQLPQWLAAKLPATSATEWDPQPITPSPIRSAGAPEPALSARNALAIDVTSGTVLYEKGADQVVPVASITKTATALVLLRRYQPDEEITIPALPAYSPEDELLGLQPGERYSAQELLEAILIHSANDAADAVAIVASGSREAFAAQMNEVVGEWGVRDARFSNPSGLNDQNNGASARSLATIGELLMRNERASSAMKQPGGLIQEAGGGTKTLRATNKLLTNGQFYGIKTGYTLASGQCFLGVTDIQGHRIITVVLGSGDRFGDSTTLRNWIEQHYTWPTYP